MADISYVIDGFNLYHSLRNIARYNRDKSAKWLDLPALCKSYLAPIGAGIRSRTQLKSIYYFSARPTHLKQETRLRHEHYMKCLRGLGVDVELARFKKKNIRCDYCNNNISRYEEKETDVAIASKLFEICIKGESDVVAVVSGDTDLAPAIRACKSLFQQVKFVFVFPYQRANKELAQLADFSVKIKEKNILKHQLPDQIELEDGTVLKKPPDW